MAIYHCTIKIISRGKGISAVGASAYRSGEIIKNDNIRQGVEQIPTVHMGVAATQMERRGIVTEKGGKNRQIREQNRLLKEVRRRIAELGKWVKENQSVNPFPPVPVHSQQPPTLLELLNTAMQQAGQPNSRYGKIKDLKSFAKAVSFLQGSNISTLSELQETLTKMKKRYWNTNSEIKQTEKLLHERKELIDQAEKYLQYRDYHKAYKETKPKKQEEYAERYRTELALYDRAERYLKEHLGSDTKLRPKAWKAEVVDLTAQKDRLYREMRSLKEEVAEAEIVKRCIEQAIPPTEQRKEKSKTHDVSL